MVGDESLNERFGPWCDVDILERRLQLQLALLILGGPSPMLVLGGDSEPLDPEKIKEEEGIAAGFLVDL